MSELIEKQKVLDVLREIATEKFSLDDPYGVYINVLMDVEEKICHLPVVKPNGPDNLVKDIQGLAKDLVNDCISRQAAIDALRTHERKASKKWFDNQLDIEWNNAIDICCYDIEDLPPAQSEQRWIPCNEKDAEYPCIACDVFGQIFITDGGIVKINGECYDGTGFDFSNADEFLKGEKVGNAMRMLPRKIVAWLPMPEPYKEDDHATD